MNTFFRNIFVKQELTIIRIVFIHKNRKSKKQQLKKFLALILTNPSTVPELRPSLFIVAQHVSFLKVGLSFVDFFPVNMMDTKAIRLPKYLRLIIRHAPQNVTYLDELQFTVIQVHFGHWYFVNYLRIIGSSGAESR